jgi:ribosomal protein L24
MIRFAVGDRVVIRYGKHQGQKANIIKTPEAHVYKVKAEDGFVLYYSGKGLEKEKEGTLKAVCGNPLGNP